jgi:regulator of sirC expression with transglutaminase-like and TPR domain
MGDLSNYIFYRKLSTSKCATYLDKALATDANDKYSLNNKGWALNGLGNYKEAI